MSSWDNLIKVLEESADHERQQAQIPQITKSGCRAYYDSHGIRMVQQGPPWHDFDPVWKWIDIDPALWDQISDDTHRIELGKLIAIDKQLRRMLKLSRYSEGDIRTVRGYVTLLLEPNEEYPEIDYWQ